LDDNLSNGKNPRLRAETGAELFNFPPRFFLIVGLDEQPELLAAITDGRVVPWCFEPTCCLIHRRARDRLCAGFGLVPQVPKLNLLPVS